MKNSQVHIASAVHLGILQYTSSRRASGGPCRPVPSCRKATRCARAHSGKARVNLSDGVDHGSKETLTEAIESAQRADTVVYSIRFSDEQAYGSYHGYGTGSYGGGHGGHYPRQEHPDGKKVLETISNLTGGRLFQVSKKETVDNIYAEIDTELRNQYSLGYSPAKDLAAGYHKIHLTTNNKDLKVQARGGYYSGPPASSSAAR